MCGAANPEDIVELTSATMVRARIGGTAEPMRINPGAGRNGSTSAAGWAGNPGKSLSGADAATAASFSSGHARITNRS